MDQDWNSKAHLSFSTWVPRHHCPSLVCFSHTVWAFLDVNEIICILIKPALWEPGFWCTRQVRGVTGEDKNLTTNQACNRWSAQHFCHSANSLILTGWILRNFASRGLSAQKSSMAVHDSLQAFALHTTAVWNEAPKTTKKGENMQTAQWFVLEKNRCRTIRPLRQQIIQMWSKKYSMATWVKAVSSKGVSASTHSSICTAPRAPNCPGSLSPRSRGCDRTTKFCHELCKTVCAPCRTLKLHAEGQIFHNGLICSG